MDNCCQTSYDVADDNDEDKNESDDDDNADNDDIDYTDDDDNADSAPFVVFQLAIKVNVWPIAEGTIGLQLERQRHFF